MEGEFGVEYGLTGTEKLISRLTVLPGNAKEMALRNMFEYARDHMMPDSKENYCPFRLGALRDSGTVWRDADFVYAEYGSPAAPASAGGNPPSEYAVDQHENMTYDHSAATGHGGGSAKYLEIPLQEHSANLIEAAAQGVDASLSIDTGLGVEEVQISFAGSLSDYLRGAVSKHGNIAKPKVTGGPRLVKRKK